jgi:hypothetical protein
LSKGSNEHPAVQFVHHQNLRPETCALLDNHQRLMNEIHRICRLIHAQFPNEMPESIALFLGSQRKIDRANEMLKCVERKLSQFGFEGGHED